MTGSESPHASIVIPTRNGMPLVERCLRAILAQETPWPYEVIVVDSESSDGTWELLGELGVQRLRISPREFNHGATRNLGASRARGQFLVFHVQDAIPADQHWLVNLVSACDDPQVAGAYSRQRPRPESSPITKYLTLGTTPVEEAQERRSLPPGVRLGQLPPQKQFQLAQFENNSSCIRRAVWQAHRFDAVPYGEDVEWGKRVIEAGYTLVYEPRAIVYHSHDRSALYALKRAYADHFHVAQLFGWVMVPTPPRAFRAAVWNTVHAWRYIWRTKRTPRTIARYATVAPFYMLALCTGQFLGARVQRDREFRGWLLRLDQMLRTGV